MATATPRVQDERPLEDALQAIRTRRAVKEYLDTPIPKEWIEELIDAAHWAPNHHLTHPWRFHVFTGPGRERLVSARQAAVTAAAERKGEQVSEEALDFARKKCYSAPAIIIVSMVGDENPIMDRENYAACWCAIENLLIAATARGLGSYPSTGDWIDYNFVGPVLGLTEKERPVACIFLGYSDQETMGKRLPAERHTHWYTTAAS
ncbi:MAG TPA: nitroreductase [Chloroflexota bacterium]|nr:nitroreductase [Chloroflexota bacterium]